MILITILRNNDKNEKKKKIFFGFFNKIKKLL